MSEHLEVPVRKPSGPSARVVAYLAAAALLMMGAAVFVPGYMSGRAHGGFNACRNHVVRLGKAAEKFASEHAGNPPATLQDLAPGYVKAVPTCPLAGSDTYSAGFAPSSTGSVIVCAGHHHGGVGAGANYPQYRTGVGLVER